MTILIAYDIPSDRRRDKVSRLLLDYGERIQYSVFECQLSQARYDELRERLVALVNQRRDRVSLYPICQSCFERAQSLGPAYTGSVEH